MTSPPAPTLTEPSRVVVGMVGYIDPRLFEDDPSYLLANDLPNHIQNLFEEWGQPIPIGVEYLEDEVELCAIVTNVNMHSKAIDFNMQDTKFDCDIDVEFYSDDAYMNKKLYGITTYYFVLQ